ncbi:MAG: tRNA preQ1(34) S-adenosylmethionine ribosyltransferase-isomerase QueA [Bacilli bacterium]|nr:tRNA preQ1(34) S-adenosylmethionine ribosyltransferase-isomerase QueA [Bacilli bacterium]
MDIELFNYRLPEELIAQSPANKRDNSRLLVINKSKQTYEDKHFYDIIDYLQPGDVLVRNNTKVLPVRLFASKEDTNAHVEVLLLKEIKPDTYECLCGNAKVIKVGTILNFSAKLKGECLEVKDEGIRIIHFLYQGIFVEILEAIGHMPLPPYIKKQLVGNDRYQTVYAKKAGSAAAPTAGFHFTEELFQKLKKKGVEILDVTLHIGLDTFRPVKVKDTKDHHMHSEYYEISEETANALNKAKQASRRIIAVGTTATRTLEANMSKYGRFKATKENTDIFIYPGYTFKAINALITNFHLPKSTLVMLVSAFMGREFTLACYEHAVKEKYRFFSFGDACYIY